MSELITKCTSRVKKNLYKRNVYKKIPILKDISGKMLFYLEKNKHICDPGPQNQS